MQNNQDNAGLRGTIAELNASWNAAFNRGDFAAVADKYDAAATVMPAGAAQVSGQDAIRGFWQSLIEQGVVDHAIELLEVGSDGGLAFQRGKWSAAAVDAQGNRQQFGGSLQLLYRRQADGSWKVLTHIWN